jgi:hypothetical protein
MRGDTAQKMAPANAAIATAGQRPVIMLVMTMPTQMIPMASVLSGGHESWFCI